MTVLGLLNIAFLVLSFDIVRRGPQGLQASRVFFDLNSFACIRRNKILSGAACILNRMFVVPRGTIEHVDCNLMSFFSSGWQHSFEWTGRVFISNFERELERVAHQ